MAIIRGNADYISLIMSPDGVDLFGLVIIKEYCSFNTIWVSKIQEKKYLEVYEEVTALSIKDLLEAVIYWYWTEKENSDLVIIDTTIRF